MAKITKVVCDIKLCTRKAEREFEVNGKKMYVCGEQCFTRFWSREYGAWKDSPYRTQIELHHPAPLKDYRLHKTFNGEQSSGIFRPNFQIVKPFIRIVETGVVSSDKEIL